MSDFAKDMICVAIPESHNAARGPATHTCPCWSVAFWVVHRFPLIGMDESGALLRWELMPLLPLMSGFGSLLLGMIVGGSGLFDKEQMAFVPAPKATFPEFHFTS
jgi:hypothetical protein